MMVDTLAFEPVDVLIPRGNRLFGGGVHGEAEMPPCPSVFAGALASRALADAGRVGEITDAPDRAEDILAQQEQSTGPCRSDRQWARPDCR